MKPYIKNKLLIFAGAVALIFIYKTDFSEQIGKVLKALYPVTMSLLFAWLLLPLKVKLEALFLKKQSGFLKKHSNAVSATIVYIAFILVIAVFFIYLIPLLYEGITNAAGKLSRYYSFISKYTNTEIVTSILEKINPKIYITSAKNTVSVLVNAGMTLVILIYVLLEHKELKSFAVCMLETLIGSDKTEKLLYYLTKTNMIFFSYFYGKILSSVILGVMITAGFLAIRISYPVFFGIIVAISNLVPVFGAFISIIPIAITTFAEYGIKKTIAAIIIITAGQQIENNILTPKIVNSTMGLSGFWVLFSVTLGGGLFGFWGILVCIPAAAAVKVIFADIMSNRKSKPLS